MEGQLDKVLALLAQVAPHCKIQKGLHAKVLNGGPLVTLVKQIYQQSN